MNEKKWIISYCLNNDLQSVTTIQLIALSEFNETGKYSEKECDEIVKIIHSVPLPKFEKEYLWGGKTLEEWDDFVNEVNIKIKNYE